MAQSTTDRLKLPGTDVSGLSVAGIIRASWAEVLFNSYKQKSYLNKQFDAKMAKYFLQLIVVFFIIKKVHY